MLGQDRQHLQEVLAGAKLLGLWESVFESQAAGKAERAFAGQQVDDCLQLGEFSFCLRVVGQVAEHVQQTLAVSTLVKGHKRLAACPPWPK